MENALFGTEIEYACAGRWTPAEAAIRTKDGVFGNRLYGVIEPAPREWGEIPGNGGFLYNGGRLYLDSGHLEYASPECRTLDDLIAAEVAGDRILSGAVARLGQEGSVFFIKNNTDHFGHTFGYHENYCLRVSPRSRDMVEGLLPFLVTRQIFAGAGMVVPARRTGRSRGGEATDTPYHLSQRAAFVSVDVSHRVRFGGRPILNLRDEPLAGGLYRRLHIIIGDANRSEYTTALKIGTTAIVAQLLELGWDPGLELENPVQALRDISRNTRGGWTARFVDRGTLPAVEVQRVYLHEATRQFLGRDQDTDWVLRNWAQVINGLELDPLRLDGHLDWVTKWHQLNAFAEQSPQGWADPQLIKVDLAYHHVEPRTSLYESLRKRNRVSTLVDEQRIERAITEPPPDTRAVGRSRVIRALADARADTAIRWDLISRRLGERALWGDEPFFIYSYLEDWQDIRDTGSWHIIPYLVDWGAIAVRDHVLELPDPFNTHLERAEQFARTIPGLLRK